MDVFILNLPTELLIVVASYLSSRDKAKLQYVSQRLRTVSETPSLWREFVWDYYDTREELCVKNVLKRCGEHIKRLAFPGYLTPKLNEMLQYCNNVRHVSLPVVMTLSPDQLALLGEAVQHMKHLHTLDIGWDTAAVDIKSVLLIGARLHELTLFIRECALLKYDSWLDEWLGVGCRPSTLNIIFTIRPIRSKPDFKRWHEWNSRVPAGRTACLQVYPCLRLSLNLSLVMPIFQVEFGQAAAFPYVQAKQCGLQGLEYLQLTDCCKDGKVSCKATTIPEGSQRGILLRQNISSIGFITHFNIMWQSSNFLPDHLEQLAMACPNLQQLILRGSCKCLSNLKGLRAVASYCGSLHGLNISDISVTELESQIKLWEILSSMKLTHLAVDYCIISPRVNKEYLVSVFVNFFNLVALEYWHRIGFCDACSKAPVADCSLLSHFPSLQYARVFNCHSTSAQNIITSCKKLKFCRIVAKRPSLLLSTAYNINLQHLFIDASYTDMPDAFMSSVSAHGELVHVFLSVASATIVGIGMLIENSSKLITFQTLLEIRDKDDNILPINEFLKCEMILRQKFHHRQLFYKGGYKMLQQSVYHDKHLLDISFLEETNVYYLGDANF